MAFPRAWSPVLALLLAPTAAAVLRGTGAALGAVGARIQPAAVSHLLSEVERQWQAEALAVLQNKHDAAASLGAMVDSCVKVSKAIVGGSEGSKDKVVEYLQEVCGADTAGQDIEMCKQYASAFEAHLSDDMNANREDLNLDGFCQTFYRGPIMEAAKQQQTVMAAGGQEVTALSAEDRQAAERKSETEAYIMSKAARDHLQQVKEIMARVTRNFAEVSKEADASAGGLAEAEQIADRARRATKIADEKALQMVEEREAEEAEAKAKAAKDKLEQLRVLKEAAPKAAEEADKAGQKVALVARGGKQEPASAGRRPRAAGRLHVSTAARAFM